MTEALVIRAQPQRETKFWGIGHTGRNDLQQIRIEGTWILAVIFNTSTASVAGVPVLCSFKTTHVLKPPIYLSQDTDRFLLGM